MMPDYTGKPAASFDFKKIKYEKRDLRAIVTFNRPEVLNAVDGETLMELNAAFLDASWDDDVRVLILTGAGDRAFCTGADVKEQAEEFVDQPNKYWKWMGLFIECHERLRNLGKPTIARLNGMVVGGGNEFNMSCDLAVAADHVTIRQVGAARGSVAAAGATQFLPLIIGDRRAREMLFMCEPIPAQQALAWGLVNRVTPADTYLDEARALALKLAAKPPLAVQLVKESVNAVFNDYLDRGLTAERKNFYLLFGTDDQKEGMRAFVEKRKPAWQIGRAHV